MDFKRAAMSTLLLMSVTILASGAVTAQDAPMPSEAEIARIVDRGQMLYDYDQAAWHSTDALQAKANLSKLPLVGRIVVPGQNGLDVIYYGKDQSGRFAVFSAIWAGGAIVNPALHSGGTRVPLSERANRFAETLELFTSGKIDMTGVWFCNKANPNFVLLPGDQEGRFLLYLMTSQERVDRWPIGGHHRFEIKDGKASAPRAFSKGCINMDKAQSPGQAVAFVVSHILDPSPTEIHVFTALASKMPIAVGTTQNKITWAIEVKSGLASVRAQDSKQLAR